MHLKENFAVPSLPQFLASIDVILPSALVKEELVFSASVEAGKYWASTYTCGLSTHARARLNSSGCYQ